MDSDPVHNSIQSGEESPHSTTVLSLLRGTGLVAHANLADQTTHVPAPDGYTPLFSTASPRYGGDRTTATPLDALLPFELLLFGNAEFVRSDRLQPVPVFPNWLSSDSQQSTG